MSCVVKDKWSVSYEHGGIIFDNFRKWTMELFADTSQDSKLSPTFPRTKLPCMCVLGYRLEVRLWKCSFVAVSMCLIVPPFSNRSVPGGSTVSYNFIRHQPWVRVLLAEWKSPVFGTKRYLY
jgi:hypothetical protein